MRSEAKRTEHKLAGGSERWTGLISRLNRRKRSFALWPIIVWLVVWQLGAMAMNSEVLLPGPLAVLIRLAELAPQPEFWGRVGFSLARILTGFALGAALGAGGALAAARWHVVEDLLSPLVTLAKSVPVASITVLALIWLRAANLAVLVVLLVALPVVYENALHGLRACDPRLVEVAALFHVRGVRRLRFLAMPTLYPYLRAALLLGLGTAWKAGVAAEVIGIPTGSLGEAIYDTKVYFDTAGLFAVTLVAVAASALCCVVLRRALDLLEPMACGKAGHGGAIERAGGAPQNERTLSEVAAANLVIEGVSKSFGSLSTLRNVAFTASASQPICLMAPSGTGKTTLLLIIAGLVRPDAGSITLDDGRDCTSLPRISMSFQDDRLADQASALANARIGNTKESPAWDEAPGLLEALGLDSRLQAAAGSCSGGERRRIGIARALLVPHDVLLLDEPFNGLDIDTKEQVATVIRARERGRVVIMASHDRHDAELLGARILTLRVSDIAASGR